MVVTRYAIKFRTAVYVLIVMLTIGGLVSYFSLPRESTPDIKIPVVVSSVVYPGASPTDIEKLILTPLESELKGLKDVEKMTGTAYEGAAVAVVEFSPSANIDEALQAVRDRVNQAKPDFPADAEEPTVSEISFSDFPIIIVNIAGDYSLERLKRYAEDIQDRIEGVRGVLAANLSGGIEEQFVIDVDPEKATARGVALGDVARAIRGENVNLPGGELDAEHTSYLLRTPADFKDDKDIRETIVKAPGGKAVRLTDIADVRRGFKEPDSYARINGKNCVSLQITKRTGANIIEVVDAVKAIVDEERATAPAGTTMTLLNDQSVEIRQMVNDLVNNILTGLVLVILVVFFFMGGVNATLVSIAVPLSMLITFIVLDAMGVSLNIVTLFSLILALGMLVDNAIVVVENIYRHLGEKIEAGADRSFFNRMRIVAAYTGTAEVAWPVIASTATTLAAFAPLLFWPGVMGKFMQYLPLVVIITLTSSLFVGLVINPVMAAALMTRPKNLGAAEVTDDDWDTVYQGPLSKLYRWALELAVGFKSRSVLLPIGTLLASFVMLVGVIMAYGAADLGVEFFPETTPKRATVKVTAPNGTHLEGSDRIVRQLEAVLGKHPNVRDFVATPGSTIEQFQMGGGASPHLSGIQIDFPDEDERVESTLKTIDDLRASFGRVAGARIEVDREKMGPPAGSPIHVEVTGDDYDKLGLLANELVALLRTMYGDGVRDPKTDFVAGRPEVQVVVDRLATREVGASTGAVASAIRSAFNGDDSNVIRDGTDEYDIVVRQTEDRAAAQSDLSNVMVPGKDGILVPLDQLVTSERRAGAGTVRHLDQKRVVTVQADVAQGVNADKVRKALAKRLDAELKLPAGYGWKFGGENVEQEKAGAFLGRAMMVGCFAILMILVTQFNSMIKPVIIMSSVVLSLVGVFGGLLITGKPFGVVMTGLGVISLAGVVVNNAIVLIDFIEQLRRQGLGLYDAVLRAGLTRLRPVLLTALTTVLGLVPMAIGWSVDFINLTIAPAGSTGEFWGGMAIAVIFGLVFATFLTLVVVPALYVLLERMIGAFRRRVFGSDATIDLDSELDLIARGGGSVASLLGLASAGLLSAALAVGTPGPALAQNAGAAPAVMLAEPDTVRTMTLAEALQQARKSAPDLQTQRKRLQSAELLVDRAYGALHPIVTAQGTWAINAPKVELSFVDTQQIEDDAKAQVDGHIQTLAAVRDQIAANGQGTQVIDDAIADQTAIRDGINVPPIDPVTIVRRHQLTGQLQAQMSLFDARTFDGLKIAKASVKVARTAKALTTQTVLHAAAQAYLGAAMQRQALGVIARRLETARKELDAAQKRFEAGVVPPLPVRVAELTVVQTQRAVAQTQLAYHMAVAALGLVIGVDERFDVDPAVAVPLPPGVVKELATEAEKKRADLQLVDQQQVMTRLRIRETKNRFWPRFGLVAQAQWQNVEGFAGQNTTAYIGVSVTQYIWDGRTSAIDRREQELALAEQAIEARKLRARAEAEIRGALARVGSLDDDLVAAEQAVAVSQQAVKDATLGLEAGTNTELDLRRFEDQALEAELGVVQKRVEREMAVLSLRQAMGLGPLDASL